MFPDVSVDKPLGQCTSDLCASEVESGLSRRVALARLEQWGRGQDRREWRAPHS